MGDGIDREVLNQFQLCAYVSFQKHHSAQGYKVKKFGERCHSQNNRLENQN